MASADQFATLLRAARKRQSLTQFELAERATCSESAIRKFENGQRRPSEQVAELLAAALGLNSLARVRFLRAARGLLDEAEEVLPPTNLPAHLSSLVGRDEAVDELAALLGRDEVRLVTVVGPPGIGKTRLAETTAARLLRDFEDGVFMAALATAREPAQVLPAIAATLGLRDNGREPLSLTVRDHLRNKRLLLVLDNFEQVIAAATIVSDLLGQCPRLKVLVTSRELLRLRGERHLDLAPLALPGAEDEPSPAELARFAAVELFVERAREAAPAFQLTADNAAAVARICRIVDGLPLAIELVAARVRLLPPGALLDLLQGGKPGRSGSLNVLSAGARDLPERHRTLRNAIGWSYDLLNPAERALFNRLGVFNGGWTLAGAEAVGNAQGDLDLFMLDGLTSLLDKNLIRRQPAPDEARFTMLETIREYAISGLEARGEMGTVRHWHAEYFLALAQATEPQLLGPDQHIWFARLEADHDNLRGALGWLLERGEYQIAGQLAGALTRFWLVHGHMTEGRDWLGRVLAASDTLIPATRAKVLLGLGVLERGQGDYGGARARLEESLAIAEQTGDRPGVAVALKELGVVYDYQGEMDTATDYLQRSLAEYRDLEDWPGVAACQSNLGIVASLQGQREEARRLFGGSLEVARRIGDRLLEAKALNNLGFSHYEDGDLAAAADYLNRSVVVLQEVGDRAGIAINLNSLGELAHARGNYAEAIDYHEHSLKMRRALNDRRGISISLYHLSNALQAIGEHERALLAVREALRLVMGMAARRDAILALESFAKLAVALGVPEQAVCVYAAVGAAREAVGMPLTPAYQAEREHNLSLAREQLTEVAYDEAWQAGAAMSLEQAVALALQIG